MITSVIFVRIVPADRDRGFTCLVGYDANIVQRTAIQQISITVATQQNVDAVFAKIKASYNASEIRNVTQPGILKRLTKAFGEHEAS